MKCGRAASATEAAEEPLPRSWDADGFIEQGRTRWPLPTRWRWRYCLVGGGKLYVCTASERCRVTDLRTARSVRVRLRLLRRQCEPVAPPPNVDARFDIEDALHRRLLLRVNDDDSLRFWAQHLLGHVSPVASLAVAGSVNAAPGSRPNISEQCTSELRTSAESLALQPPVSAADDGGQSTNERAIHRSKSWQPGSARYMAELSQVLQRRRQSIVPTTTLSLESAQLDDAQPVTRAPPPTPAVGYSNSRVFGTVTFPKHAEWKAPSTAAAMRAERAPSFLDELKSRVALAE